MLGYTHDFNTEGGQHTLKTKYAYENPNEFFREYKKGKQTSTRCLMSICH